MESPSSTGSPARSPSDPPTVEWRYDAGTVGWLRAVAAVGVALVGGVLVALAGAACALVGWLLLGGQIGSALLVVFLLAVLLLGRRLSLLLFPSAVRDAGEGTPVVPFTYVGGSDGLAGFDRRTSLGLALVGGVALAGAAWVASPLALGLVGVGVVAIFLQSVLSTRCTFDPGNRTLSDRYAERSLETLAGFSARRLGPLVLFRLSYPNAPGSLSRPRNLLVPATKGDAVERGLEHVVARSAREDADRRESNPLVRIVGGGLGLLFLAAGGALVTVGGTAGWILTGTLGVFALLLFWVAVLEG
jgi:hypothetical protein